MAMSRAMWKKDASEIFLEEARKAVFEALVREQMMGLEHKPQTERTDKADMANLRHFNYCTFLRN
ncbi:MAG: hypothetical protein ACE5F7_00570 [Nitrospiria bacterium]